VTEAPPRSGALELDLERRHPLYDEFVRQYEFLFDSYTGGEAYAPEKYLDKYLRETDTQYDLRKQRAYYLNYTAAVVDAYIAQIYRRDPMRELPPNLRREDRDAPPATGETPQSGDSPTPTEDTDSPTPTTNATPSVATNRPRPAPVPNANDKRTFEEDATGEGDSLTDFARETMTWALAALRAFVMVDVDDEGVPYCHQVHPSNLLDFARDPHTGDYLWALVAEKYVEEADPFVERIEEERFRLWLPERWLLFDKDGNLIEQGANAAGIVPLIEVVPGNMPLPMHDVAKINQRIYNISSQIDEILVNVTFPQPYLQAGEEGVDTGSGTAIADDVSPIQMGTTRMFMLDPESRIPPGYLVPPDGPLQRQMEERERLIGAIYSLAGLERQDPDAQDVQSGVAKSYDFKETNARLGQIAQACERLEMEILFLVSMYQDSGDFNVVYRKDYNVRDFRLVLEDYVVISETNLPPPVKKRSAMELANQIAEDATPEEKEEIRLSIEAMGEEDFVPTKKAELEQRMQEVEAKQNQEQQQPPPGQTNRGAAPNNFNNNQNQPPFNRRG
jgi:hypothetical protein